MEPRYENYSTNIVFKNYKSIRENVCIPFIIDLVGRGTQFFLFCSLSLFPPDPLSLFVTFEIMTLILQKRFNLLRKLGDPTITLPGREIPDWVSNQSSGSDITPNCRSSVVRT